MRRWNWLRSLLLALGVLLGYSLQAQVTDSLKQRLATLDARLRSRLIKDTDYLNAVDSIAPMLEGDDSLPQRLSNYRSIVFNVPARGDDPPPGRHRAYYYTFMALNAYNASKFGAAIYYSEKNNDERLKAGLFEKGDLNHSDFFALTLYYNNHDYPRVIMRLLTLGPALGRMPAAVAAETASAQQVFLALSILQTAVYTYARTGDTAARLAAWRLAESIQDKVRAYPAKGRYTQQLPQYAYLRHSTAYRNELSLGNLRRADSLLHTAINDVESPRFPQNLRADYGVSLYTEAVDFYFDHGKVDSARRYLDILHGHGGNALFAVTDPGFLLINESRLLAGEGRYPDAYQSLRKAWLLRDSAYFAVSSDRDNNLYALAEAENARTDLFRSEESKRAARQSNLILFFILSVLVLGGLSTFAVYRARQRQRLFNLQLHLAGNFHDTVGPMLIYANALVKKESEHHPSPGLDELKTQIATIMEAVRGISHDLKSSRLGTINGLGKDLGALLEKIRDATGIAFDLTVENGSPILSHFQLTHLSKIVHELISNSVKHAACNTITIALKGQPRGLLLHYTDNGKGLDPAASANGIGLDNIRERVASLQGHLELNNAFPEGYSIALSIPLL